jgi:hypothetical protein
MVHTPANEVLLTLVALRHLIVVSGLLLLRGLPLSAIVELAWSVLAISFRTTVGIVSHLTTSKTSITTGGSKDVVSHRCARRSALAILRKVGTLH